MKTGKGKEGLQIAANVLFGEDKTKVIKAKRLVPKVCGNKGKEGHSPASYWERNTCPCGIRIEHHHCTCGKIIPN